MFTALLIFVLVIYVFRKRSVRGMKEKDMCRSSYFDTLLSGEKRCTQQALAILQELGGHKRFLVGSSFLGEGGEKVSIEIIMIHESGIYVFTTKDYEGWIYTGLNSRYWVQNLGGPRFLAWKNYFYNPFLFNRAVLGVMRWELKDMPWLPFYNIAVFSDAGIPDDPWLCDRDRRLCIMNHLSYAIYDLIRHRGRFLKPELIDSIYERLLKLVVTDSLAPSK